MPAEKFENPCHKAQVDGRWSLVSLRRGGRAEISNGLGSVVFPYCPLSLPLPAQLVNKDPYRSPWGCRAQLTVIHLNWKAQSMSMLLVWDRGSIFGRSRLSPTNRSPGDHLASYTIDALIPKITLITKGNFSGA
jgi:hypothetical protein